KRGFREPRKVSVQRRPCELGRSAGETGSNTLREPGNPRPARGSTTRPGEVGGEARHARALEPPPAPPQSAAAGSLARRSRSGRKRRPPALRPKRTGRPCLLEDTRTQQYLVLQDPEPASRTERPSGSDDNGLVPLQTVPSSHF